MNEDIVIPLDTLAEFARFVDATNIEEERYAQLRFAQRAEEVFTGAQSKEDREQIAAKTPAALELCARFREELQSIGVEALRGLTHLQEFREGLAKLVRGYPAVLASLDRAYKEVRDRRIVLATHMHAGDGNVHVNVPVLSNDRPMLERTDHVIDRVMEKVISLGGVVSGEHGIGLTKLKYLEPERIAELSAYRREVDPGGMMNPGKLEDLAGAGAHLHALVQSARTGSAHSAARPVGRALAQDPRIACAAESASPIAASIIPAQGMFYHPRNKNLAIGSLIEALLYDAQRERSTHFELLQWLEEVADHCTICHKCLKPCPVDIDTGEVTVLEREILSSWGYKTKPLATQLTLKYLDSSSPAFNKLFRTSVVQIGGAAQRVMSKLVAPLQPSEGSSAFYPLRLLASSVAPVPSQTLRDVLPECAPGEALVFEPEKNGNGDDRKTVFYFPGCGSERLYSDISMAAIHLLAEPERG